MSPFLASRDQKQSVNELLKLISSPFKSTFQVNAVWLSLASALSLTVILAFLFSIIRPYHTVVYAPKTKHADNKHAPPPAGRGVFSWIKPVFRTKEHDLVSSIGLDAIVFLRFTNMCRNIFVAMTVVGCAVMIPINIVLSRNDYTDTLSMFTTLSPQFVSEKAVWSQVVCTWAFDIIIIGFLWWNYRAVVGLRRKYFESPEYQRSLHARTLMVTDIPSKARSDEGLSLLTEKVNPIAALPRAVIGRNVKELPRLVNDHDRAVRKLESILAKYLKHPDRLPPKRPTMRPPRREGGKGHKVDAIEYLTMRIRLLEGEIGYVRASIDQRGVMPFGFVSWDAIEYAHAVAYATRKKHPDGATISLAPRPSDIIWENMSLSKAARRWRRFVNVIWVAALTIVWIAPNAMIAIFLSNLNNLGHVWPAFQRSLDANPKVWAAVQGIAAPAVTSLVYLILPIIFRRLAIRAGNLTKTAREQDVLDRLYAFFVFNNLVVFSLFSAAWTFTSAVLQATKNNENAWQAVQEGHLFGTIFSSLLQVSPFWVTWLMQRTLGSAIDLAQLSHLARIWLGKTFFAPTPRQAIEWTAPPSFDYASYCNYFLFYTTVAMCFATLQPIVLPVTAFYFALDAIFRKYLLLYVFVTKNESDGQMWRLLFNRMIFATILANFMAALAIRAKGNWTMVFCLIPLPFMMLGLKVFCMKKYDADIEYYSRGSPTDVEAMAVGKSIKTSDRLISRFGHPALYKPLITPMVHAKAVYALQNIYQGRLDSSDVSGEFSDVVLDPMESKQPGRKRAATTTEPAPFEFVPENQLDFSYFKDRPDFRDELSGGIYGRPEDLITERSQTPRSLLIATPADDEYSPSPSYSRPPSSLSASSLPLSLSNMRTRSNEDLGAIRAPTPLARLDSANSDHYQTPGFYHHRDESEMGLLEQAQPPAQSAAPLASLPALPSALGRWRNNNNNGYGRVRQDESFPYESYRMPR